jgi:hypothetical protein
MPPCRGDGALFARSPAAEAAQAALPRRLAVLPLKVASELKLLRPAVNWASRMNVSAV